MSSKKIRHIVYQQTVSYNIWCSIEYYWPEYLGFVFFTVAFLTPLIIFCKNELLRGKPRSIRSFGTTSIVLGEVVYIHLLFPAPEYMF